MNTNEIMKEILTEYQYEVKEFDVDGYIIFKYQLNEDAIYDNTIKRIVEEGIDFSIVAENNEISIFITEKK